MQILRQVLLFLFVLLLITEAHAQVTLRVKVKDDRSGEPLIRASVQILETKQGAYTNDSGIATIEQVKPGKYTIRVKFLGYEPYMFKDLQVSTASITVTASLKQGNVDSLLIEATRPTVEKSRVEQGRRFSSGEVENTPGRQRLDEIIKLTPGVTNSTPQVNGGRSHQNTIHINGTEMQDVAEGRTSAIQNSLSKYAISEHDIKTIGMPDLNRESYALISETGFKLVNAEPLSTFSVDVDRASYANIRRYLTSNMLPPKDAVRVEEMINYFKYDFPQPKGSDPIAIVSDMTHCPWNEKHRIIQVSLKGREIAKDNLPPANLVFLIDVSGSMNSNDKLPLVQAAFRLLVEQLRKEDRVSIVTYAGNAGLVLPSTSGNEKEKILDAINSLSPGGSTAGAAGIELAYQIAKQNKGKGINSRVILATDGDFNVGVSSDAELVRLIEKKRSDGIFLTVLGFGTGNYQDAKMEQLADKGNGNFAYCDNLLEAQKVFVNEIGGTLNTIAKDVKLQIEFNPKFVQAYRLIGYDNRRLNNEDFNNDKKDAAEMGAGHEVTALYEIVPAGVEPPQYASVDSLKYQIVKATHVTSSDEVMTVKFRYKDPEDSTSKLVTHAVRHSDELEASENLRFSMAVAQFAMLLRDSEHKGTTRIADVIQLATSAKGHDKEGYRAEFIRLLHLYSVLKPS